MAATSSVRAGRPGHSLGLWLPHNHHVTSQWLAKKLKQVEQLEEANEIQWKPVIKAMAELVHGNPFYNSLSEQMFTQIPPAYSTDPTGKPQVPSFDKALSIVNIVLDEGPQWYYITKPDTAMGLIGFPINAIFDWPMGTQAGYDFFRIPDINQKWHDILSSWSAFLISPQSKECLNTSDGWLSKVALEVLAQKGNDGTTHLSFQQLYNCDPSLPFWGFESWDEFFTRTFRDGVRPIAAPEDDRIILNACESTPLQYRQNVQLHDTFWLKAQPYSLYNMLNNDPNTSQFVGGNVYQAFLSALSYHRWHSPVNGTVVSTHVVPGTYYSENLYQGFANPISEGGPDPSAPNNSQPYIASVATRGIIFIQADSEDIGLMAIIFIGMAEVSSCEFTVLPNQRISKGQELGMFHFGGSSHCMVFRPGTNLHFETDPNTWDPNAPNNNMINSLLAVVNPVA